MDHFSKNRLSQMKVIEIAYLTKGLHKLGNLFEKENRILELELRDQIVNVCLKIFDTKTERFDPYSMSKIMKYVSKYDSAMDQKTLRLYSKFGK